MTAGAAFVLVFATNFPGSAQNSSDAALPVPTTSQILPPGPNAAALGRYGEIPVGLYTGLTSIAVPLYTVDAASGVRLPLALNYHASGIKVDDVPSWVGLGWSLDCGGVVTRTVHGLPDELPAGYQHQASVIDSLDGDGYRNRPDQRYALLSQAADETLDLEPDTYAFNFAGHAGQIVFDHQGNAVAMPFQKLQIQYTLGTGFRIVTEDGTAFVFQDKEASLAAPDGDSNRKIPYISSWYLSRIEPVLGPPITFAYGPVHPVTYPANYSESRPVTVSTTGSSSLGRGILKTSYTALTVSAITLRQISSATARVRFYSDSLQRTDVVGATRLDSLVVFSAQGARVKRMVFRYVTGAGNRLFLQEVEEQAPGTAGQALPPYRFRYSPELLPPLYSKQQDHWGYCNTANAVTTMIPTTTLSIRASDGSVNPITFPGADRSPNAQLMQAGALIQINYPTGGSTDFEYEPHDYGYLGRTSVPTRVITQVRKVGLESILSSTRTFVAHDSVRVKFTRNQTIHVVGSTNEGMQSGTKTGAYGEAEGGYICRTCSQLPYPQVVLETGNYVLDKKVDVYPGVYTFYTSYTRTVSGSSPGHASLTISYDDSLGVQNSLMAGGLRIRRVTSTPKAGGLPVVKEYVYRMESDTSRSSGSAVADLPTYLYFVTQNVCAPSDNQEAHQDVTSTVAMLTSNGNGQPGMTQGAPVGYREVTVLDGAAGLNGKTVYKYTSAYDHEDSGFPNFPFAPSTSFDYQRGQLMLATEYQRSPTGFQPLRSTTNTYILAPSTPAVPLTLTVVGLKVGRTFRNSSCGLTAPYPDEFRIQRYRYIAQWMYLAQTVVRQYAADDANQYSETTTALKYGNSQHLQLTHREQTSSDGSRLITTYRYPLDVAGAGTPADEPSLALGSLVARHMLTPVVEQQRWRGRGADSVLVGAELTHYAGLLPKRIFQFVAAGPIAPTSVIPTVVQASGLLGQDTHYREAVVFDAYDETGNVLQQHRSYDQSSSYLWGYHNNLPVVQVQNATRENVQTALTALGLTAEALEALTTDGQTTDAQLRDIFARLRQQLPKGRVTGLTYKPLVGLTSQTDPSGRTVFYEYDGLNRLVRTRDEQGHILSQQQYHYAGK